MKILALVDLHGSINTIKKIADFAKKEKADYIISAGDHTIFSDSNKEIIKKFDEIGIPVIILHGNHEDEITMRQICEKTKNVRFMHKEVLEHGDYLILAYGGGGFSTKDAQFESWVNKTMTKIPEGKKIILVTHAPPYGTKLDRILDQPAGCKSIRQFIKQVQPKIAISGHLHENAGLKDRIDKTKIANPGPSGMIFVV